MIYHLDTVLDGNDTTGHATAMLSAMRQYYNGEIKLYSILNKNNSIDVNVILDSLELISECATKNDVVSFNFLLTYNVNSLTKKLNEITKTSNVVAAAGNNSNSINKFCPVNSLDAKCIVGCLNKKGETAQLSNYGNVGVWVTGTSQKFKINNKMQRMSGTSISAAYYAGYLASKLEGTEQLLSDIKILINN